jgi:hypothetical protein
MDNVDKYLQEDEDEVNDISLTENDDELIEEDEEYEEVNQIPLTKKRRVVGIIRRQPTANTPREISGYPPSSAPVMPMIQQDFYPQQRFNPQQQHMSVEQSVKERVKADMLYQQMMMREQQKFERQNRPRMTVSQKFLKVANDSARGDGSNQHINEGISGTFFRKPNVSITKPRFQSLDNLNSTIKKIRPNVSPIMQTAKKKKKR